MRALLQASFALDAELISRGLCRGDIDYVSAHQGEDSKSVYVVIYLAGNGEDEITVSFPAEGEFDRRRIEAEFLPARRTIN
jgi:hypothetical protein